MASPTSRSLEMLRKAGWTVAIVEKFNRFGGAFGVRQDLFGFIDILSIREDFGFLGVQTTSDGDVNRRLKKIAAEPRALIFIRAGGRIAVHGWKKGGKRSPKPGKWICRVVNYPKTELCGSKMKTLIK